MRDSGLTHSLLGIHNLDALLGHPVVGMSWERFVIENLHSVLPASAKSYFYRTSAGAEIDFLIEFSSGKRWVFEIKRGLSPKIKKGFCIALKNIQPDKSFIIYSGDESYQISDEITVHGLTAAMKEIRKQA